MKNLSIILISSLLALSLTSCEDLFDFDNPNPDGITSGGEWGSGNAVNPNNPNEVDSQIDVEDGIRMDGDSPDQTGNTADIWGHLTSVTSTKDQAIFLPFEYKTDVRGDGIQYVFVEVVGATSHWRISYFHNNQTQGRAVIKMNLPSNIENGDFAVRYGIQDDFGNVSNFVLTTIKIIEVAQCTGDAFEGEDGLTVKSYEMGEFGSTIRVTYDTYSVPDRVDIFYDARWVGGTGSSIAYKSQPPVSECYDGVDGYVGSSGFIDIPYNPNKSRRLDVYVSGCLGGGTAWTVWVECL